MPAVTYDRLPLPVVRNYGWWFISFAPDSFFTTILGIALLYVPCLILLTTMTGSSGSFSVVFRRDYGSVNDLRADGLGRRPSPFHTCRPGPDLSRIRRPNLPCCFWH